MSSNCLLTPNGFCHLDIPLEYFFFSFFHFFYYYFFLSMRLLFFSSVGDAEYDSVTSSTQQFVWKWAILFHGEKQPRCLPQRHKKQHPWSFLGGNVIWEKSVLLNAFSYPRQRSPCWCRRCRRQILDAAELPSAENLLLPAQGQHFVRIFQMKGSCEVDDNCVL